MSDTIHLHNPGREALLPLLEGDPDVPFGYLRDWREAACREHAATLEGQSLLVLEGEGRVQGVLNAQWADWDSQWTRLPTGQLGSFHIAPRVSEKGLVALVEAAREQLVAQGATYVIARCQGRGQKGLALQQAGFQVLDGLLVMGCSPQKLHSVGVPIEGVYIRAARHEDYEPLVRLVVPAFDKSRFHTEPLIDDQDAQALHATWLQNALFHGRADQVWVAASSGAGEERLLGFATLRTLPWTASFVAGREQPCVGSLELIAVASEAQGRGVGCALVRQVLDAARELGLLHLHIATQVWNTAALRAYTNVGFVPLHSSWTFRHATNVQSDKKP